MIVRRIRTVRVPIALTITGTDDGTTAGIAIRSQGDQLGTRPR
jgi:hypothetical protein